MKTKRGYWYWFGGREGFDGIKLLPDGHYWSSSEGNAHGKFNSFEKAKQDAIEYFECDKRDAMLALQDVRKARKPK